MDDVEKRFVILGCEMNIVLVLGVPTRILDALHPTELNRSKH